MRVERYGSGPHVYFGLHGWNGDHRTFLPLVDGLPREASFVSPDLPGCGGSGPPSRWDLNSIADEIAGQLKEPVTLVGNCSGAILALVIARRFASRIKRIVMIDAFASWPWYFRVFLSPRIGRHAYFTTFANPLGRWLTNASLRSKRSAATDLTAGFRKADHETTYRYLQMLGNIGPAEQFSGLTMPIDILYGERSFSAIRESARAWAHLWPQSRTLELRGAGHLPILEAAPQVKEILFGETCV
jgi:pimeloyl-ACP methyl ester carboxylesterase